MRVRVGCFLPPFPHQAPLPPFMLHPVPSPPLPPNHKHNWAYEGKKRRLVKTLYTSSVPQCYVPKACAVLNWMERESGLLTDLLAFIQRVHQLAFLCSGPWFPMETVFWDFREGHGDCLGTHSHVWCLCYLLPSPLNSVAGFAACNSAAWICDIRGGMEAEAVLW